MSTHQGSHSFDRVKFVDGDAVVFRIECSDDNGDKIELALQEYGKGGIIDMHTHNFE